MKRFCNIEGGQALTIKWRNEIEDSKDEFRVEMSLMCRVVQPLRPFFFREIKTNQTV